GGAALLAAAIKAERAKGVPTFVAFAGDALSPSVLAGFDQGATMMEFFGLIALDAFVPGNHEFDFGPAIFAERMRAAKCPLLAANLRTKSGGAPEGFRDTFTLDLGGLQVGVVGATLETTPDISQPGPDLVFSPTVKAVADNAALLRKAGAQFVVAVVHADKPTGQRLLEIEDVDLVLSGHNHDLHLDYDGRGALMESRQDGLFVATVEIDATFVGEGAKRKLAWTPSFRVIDTRGLEPDPAAAALIAKADAALSKDLDKPVATLGVELDSREETVRTKEAALGDLVADALRAATGAEVALTNGGGLRGDKTYPVGATLTRRDFLTEMPFGNHTVLLHVTGAQLLAALENGFSQVEKGAGRFPQVSGLTVTAKLGEPAGKRVVSVEVGGKPLDPAATYSLATNDYMAKGGDGYVSLAAAAGPGGADRGARLMANDAMDYAAKLGTIAAPGSARITLE
ncbi:MAG: 5'-nucleotidase C-terminal domain-containing protein, partial [Hyphomicrobiales bacterium]|nr:5'-nucleotidase C-terminal domain-containing protein [Hyphomicrobiales bacterium]